MKVRGGLQEGPSVNLEFFAQEDLVQTEDAGQPQPTSFIDLVISESEARSLGDWLTGDRSIQYEGTTIQARGGADWAILELKGTHTTIRLGTIEQIKTVAQEINGNLALILGHGVDPSDA